MNSNRLGSNRIGKKENIPELAIVRAIAIIGVLTVHSTSVAVSTGMIDSNMFFLYNFANIFLKFGTTTFIFLSSFVLFYNYFDRPLTTSLVSSFYKRRMLYIIIPYIVFSLFYYFFKYFFYSYDLTLMEHVTKLGKQLMQGTAHAHLYFVFISIQFYILFPLFLIFFKKFPKTTRYLIIIGIVVQWSFFIINKHGHHIGFDTPVARRGSWSLSYFTYYFLGAYLGIYFHKLKAWLVIAKENITKHRLWSWATIWCLWLIAGLYHVYIYYRVRQKLGSYNTTWMDFVWNAHALLTAIVLLQLGFILYRKLPGILRGLATRLGDLSFGIYLVHPFLLLIYRLFPPQTGISMLHHLWYVGGFVVALVGSWIIVSFFARFVPHAWIVFGNLPKKPQKQKLRQDGGVNI